MEKFNINESKKNIPVPSKLQYKVEKVIKRMRWKSVEFLGKLSRNVSKESHSFQSLKCPPAVEQMADFEIDLVNMIKPPLNSVRLIMCFRNS